ncbi:hypothetical protein P4T54_05595 [Bacillus mycoides]|uniref:hypothetical protein n=1 Tax=Bacillus mycoides TaxID=1405 RepID=UPI002E250139|nr:hypothetical protein [Bacillus mycoides]
MSSVQFKIEVESYNGRSDQIAVKLIVDNSGGERIKLISLTPNVPFGVQIEERRDTSQESKKEKAIDLCLELTDILDGYLENNYEIIKAGRISLGKERVNEIFKVKSFFSVYASLFKQTLLSQELRAINRKLTSIKFTVQNLADAEWAYDKWFANLSDDIIEKGLYEGKLQQLKNLENQMSEIESNVLALIEPASSYTRSYVIKFKRRLFSQKIFNITIDGLYADENSSSQYRGTVSEPVTISPSSLALTFLAIISSILGAILKYNLEHSNGSDSISKYLMDLFTNLTTSYGLSSAIVAIVFFNIYEHINFGDFGKKINQSPNWQVALLIGALSGLMGDKIVKALNIFIGI